MNQESVNAAVYEAKRFVRAAEAYIKAKRANERTYYTNPKESGACRRASLDLTRALAEMRKPG